MEAWSAYGASDRQDVYRLSQLQSPMDDTGLDSRVFVVCGKSVEVRSVGSTGLRFQCRKLHWAACMRTGPHLPIHARHAPQEGVLTEAFAPFGKIQGVKLVRDKGGTRQCLTPGKRPTAPC